MKSNLIRIVDKTIKEEKKVKLLMIIFFMVGTIGFKIPVTNGFFIHLTPLALLLSTIVLVLFHTPSGRKKILIPFLLIFLTGFIVEVAGVKSGLIFGPYSYGKGLGIKLFETPLLIGLNWLFLVYCTVIITEELKINNILKLITASLLMVFYDLILEQMAPALDMWSFEGGTAPVRNYISWFFLSLLFHIWIRISGIKWGNRIAAFVFFLQLTFFMILLFIYKVMP